MPKPAPTTEPPDSDSERPDPNRDWRTGLLQRHHWLTFVLPFAVFLAVTALEPTPAAPQGESPGTTIPYSWYPIVYSVKIVLTLAAIAFVLPGYREFRFRASPVAGPLVGIAGVVVWVGACELNLESRWLAPLLENLGAGSLLPSGTRSAFNPFEELSGRPIVAGLFLAVRFLGLAAVVPVIEEFFLRGFAMRFVMDAQWWKIPFGRVNAAAVVAGTAIPMLTHPGELLAAALWFSMVTLLMVRTRNIWDCVVAHAVTNLLLGVYVVASGKWYLM